MKKFFILASFLLITFSCSIIEDDHLDSDELRNGNDYVNNQLTLKGYQFTQNFHNVFKNSEEYGFFYDDIQQGESVSFLIDSESPSFCNCTSNWQPIKPLYGSYLMPDPFIESGFDPYRFYKIFLNINSPLYQDGSPEQFDFTMNSNFEFDNQERLIKITNLSSDSHVGPLTIQSFEFKYTDNKITEVTTNNHLYRSNDREKLVDIIIYNGDTPVKIERQIFIDNSLAGTAEINASMSGDEISSISYSSGSNITSYAVGSCGTGCSEVISGDAAVRINVSKEEGRVSTFELIDYRISESGLFILNDTHRLPDAYMYNPFYGLYYHFQDYQVDKLMLLYLPDWWYINGDSDPAFTYKNNEFIRLTYDYTLR